MAKVCDCTEVEIEKEGMKQKVADSVKVSTLVEFMKCFPMLGRKDKNTSQATNFVMNAAQSGPEVTNYQSASKP